MKTAGSSLIKLQALRIPTVLKRDSNAGFSCKICKYFKKTLFYRLSPAAASASLRFPVCNLVKNETSAPTNIRLDEDVLIKTNMFALALRLQKTSWSRPIYLSWPYVFKTSSRRLQDVFRTSSRHLHDVLKTS